MFKPILWNSFLIIQPFQQFNSLAPGRFEQNLRLLIFKLISVTDGWGISCKIALRWMPLDLTDNKSTFVQVMAWCRQATSHYPSQFWHRFMSPYGVARPQWVKYHSTNLCPMHNKQSQFHRLLSKLLNKVILRYYGYVVKLKIDKLRIDINQTEKCAWNYCCLNCIVSITRVQKFW